MPIPVIFEATAEDDLVEYVRDSELDLLVDEIDQRLGYFPLSGRKRDPPDGFARTTRLQDYRVYYEATVNEEADEVAYAMFTCYSGSAPEAGELGCQMIPEERQCTAVTSDFGKSNRATLLPFVAKTAIVHLGYGDKRQTSTAGRLLRDPSGL